MKALDEHILMALFVVFLHFCLIWTKKPNERVHTKNNMHMLLSVIYDFPKLNYL